MQKVLVSFIQDRSGSMGDVWTETLSGYKTFVEDLKKKEDADIEYLFSLTVFDTVVEAPIVAKAIDAVSTTALKNFPPRGMTALYDAVGMTIAEISKSIEDKRLEVDKIICVIVTDGHENSSREWTKDTLNQAISDRLDAGNWTFSYLGTQPETWDDAAGIGIAVGATAGYQPLQAAATYAVTAKAVKSLGRDTLRGTRSLYSSFSSMEDTAAAGMTVQRGAETVTTTINNPTKARQIVRKPSKPPKKKPTKWR